jgi:hypothetical protein
MQFEAGGGALLQRELTLLHAQRDLCQALLGAPADIVQRFRRRTLTALERIPITLRKTTHAEAAFRVKLQRLTATVDELRELVQSLPMPGTFADLETLHEELLQLQALRGSTGDELLPLLGLLDGVMTSLRLVCGAIVPDPASQTSTRLPMLQPRRSERSPLETILQKLAARLALENHKALRLRSRGLDLVPEPWQDTLQDVSTRLLHNAVEHGIEPTLQRLAAGKPAHGVIEVRFVAHHTGYEFTFRDDGQGFDLQNIASQGRELERGLQLVLERLRRLGARIRMSSKPGMYTKLRARLPALSIERSADSASA